MLYAERECDLRRQHQRHGGDKHRLHLAAFFAINNRRDHQRKRAEQDRQIHRPMLLWRQAAVFERDRHHHEHRHLRRMQRENAEVEPQQLRVAQHVFQPRRIGAGIGVIMRVGGVRNPVQHYDYRGQRKHPGHREYARHTDQVAQCRARHQGQRKGDPDSGAYCRHGFGALLFARQIGQHRGDRSGNRACPLQRAPGDGPVDIGRQRGHKAAQRKHQQAKNNHLFAPDAVGSHAKRNHQHRLGQAVHA